MYIVDTYIYSLNDHIFECSSKPAVALPYYFPPLHFGRPGSNCPVEMDGLCVAIRKQTLSTPFPSKATLLTTCKVSHWQRFWPAIDPHGSGVYSLRQSISALNVGGPDASSQPHIGVIDTANNLILVSPRE
jgi:hypothetical protein